MMILALKELIFSRKKITLRTIDVLTCSMKLWYTCIKNVKSFTTEESKPWWLELKN